MSAARKRQRVTLQAHATALRVTRASIRGIIEGVNTSGTPPEPSAWLLLTFGDERQYAGNQGYEDDPALVYRYDSFVPNHRQLVAGDAVVLKAPDRTLGCARIERIDEHDGTKERQRCPECKTTAIKTRRTARPLYRCDAKHEFDVPIVETVECRKYAAHFGDSFVPIAGEVDVSALRSACRNYNGQLAMQRIDRALVAESIPLRLVENALRKVDAARSVYLLAEEAAPSEANGSGAEVSAPYVPSGADTREGVMRQLRARRGQGAFRQSLRATYGDRCMVTGCTLVDLLEAAHISPYRGDGDHHAENGLLLRADIHTLFDLDLVGIEPDALVIRLHPALGVAGYGDLEGRELRCGFGRPSRAALESRWAAFQRRLGRK